MICKLIRTSKLGGEHLPQEKREALGYEAITIHSVERFDGETLLMKAVASSPLLHGGAKHWCRVPWSDIESDIRNGYLVDPAAVKAQLKDAINRRELAEEDEKKWADIAKKLVGEGHEE